MRYVATARRMTGRFERLMRGPAGPTDWSWRTRTHRPRGNAAVDSDAVDAMGGRTVGDVALLLSVIAGAHRDDPMSLTDDPAPLATVHPNSTQRRKRSRPTWRGISAKAAPGPGAMSAGLSLS